VIVLIISEVPNDLAFRQNTEFENVGHKMEIRLVVADSHEVVRAGVQRLLAGTDIKVVGDAKNPIELAKTVMKAKPDVLLMEVRMGEDSALDALEKLKKQLADTKVVVFSNYDNPKYVARAHALGASDYILKGCRRDELITAITNAHLGHEPVRTGEMKRVAHAINSAAVAKHDLPITPRETEVLKHIAAGMSNKEIGKALGISVETIKEHVQNLLRKLGLTDRTQAAVLAVRMKLA